MVRVSITFIAIGGCLQWNMEGSAFRCSESVICLYIDKKGYFTFITWLKMGWLWKEIDPVLCYTEIFKIYRCTICYFALNLMIL